MAKRKSDSDKDDALLPSDILESSPKAKVQCLVTALFRRLRHARCLSVCRIRFLSLSVFFDRYLYCRKVAIRLLL